jgi:hypothetical protein
MPPFVISREFIEGLAEVRYRIRHARLCGENWLVRLDRWLEFNYLSLILGNWKRRTELLEYCTTIVDQALIEKRRTLERQAQDPSPNNRREIEGTVFGDEVKVSFNIINNFRYLLLWHY